MLLRRLISSRLFICPNPTNTRRICSSCFTHSRSSSESHILLDSYDQIVKKGELNADADQRRTVEILQRLYTQLSTYEPPDYSVSQSWLPAWLKSKVQPEQFLAPKGLYLYGGVGTGKTMLMDLFYNHVNFTSRKRRVHFHSFMLEVHSRIQALKEQKGSSFDALPAIAQSLYQDAWLLCFDEFQVIDIADAMILRRLLTELYRLGVVMLITSNRHPDELYKNGIQRASFLPCIQLLKERNLVHDLDHGRDYRQRERTSAPMLFSKVHPQQDQDHMALTFSRLIQGRQSRLRTLKVLGRSIHVHQQCEQSRVARFTFEELCARPLSAVDYLELVKHYDTFVIERIPRLNWTRRNEVRRFITLVDTLYENHVVLYCSAETDLHQLFEANVDHSTSNSGFMDEESFAFDRCLSRLTQMTSQDWLSQAKKRKSKSRPSS